MGVEPAIQWKFDDAWSLRQAYSSASQAKRDRRHLSKHSLYWYWNQRGNVIMCKAICRNRTPGGPHGAVVPLAMRRTSVGWLARLSIGKKLALSFSLILILLIGSLSASFFYLSRVNRYVERHQRITIPSVVTASEMLRNLSDMQTHMHHLHEHQNPAEQTISLNAIVEIEHRTLTALDTYQASHAIRTHPVLYGMLQQHGRGDLADQESQTIVAIADGMSALRAQREDLEAATRQSAKNLSNAEPVYEQTTTKTADAIASLIELHRTIDVEM